MRWRELSLGRTYTASSFQAGMGPDKAADHNPDNRFYSNLTPAQQWLQVDMGQSATVNEFRLDWPDYWATAYKLQVSADGKTWTDIYSTTTGQGGEERVTGLNGAGRYVRVLTSALSGKDRGIELVQFTTYGTPGTTPPPTPAGTDLARTGIATASSSDSTSRNAARAVDGDASTRWASRASDDQWIQVDLKSLVSVTGIRLKWEAAYAKAYKIQFSTDGTTWTDKQIVTNGDGGMDELPVSGQARYVRVQGVTRATKYGYSLFDFNVYGPTPPAPPPTNTASLSGTAFNDANRNGKQDSGDSVAGGKTIWLDLDDDGVKDANEPSTVTASNGAFAFKNLAAGTFHVRRVFTSGYLESTPARYVTLTAGQAAGGVLIGSRTK